MRLSRSHMARRLAFSILLASLVAACQSSPSRLYVLSSQPRPSPGATVALASTGSSGTATTRSTRVLGVTITLPEYLDRTEIVRRVGVNKLTWDHDAQWGEDLSVDATRVIVEDLEAKLPSFDVVMLPSRARRAMEYEVDVDLTRFDSDAGGKVIARGWWTIADADGREVASGRVSQGDQASRADYDAAVASMSRILFRLSAEIATAVDGLPPRKDAAKNRPEPPANALLPKMRYRLAAERHEPGKARLGRSSRLAERRSTFRKARLHGFEVTFAINAPLLVRLLLRCRSRLDALCD